MESALAGAMPPAAEHRGARSRTSAARSSGRGWPRAGRTRQPLICAPTRAFGRPSSASRRYGQSLFLMRGSNASTTAANLRALVEAYRREAPHRPLVVFVDYLQRVPVYPEPDDRGREGHQRRRRHQGPGTRRWAWPRSAHRRRRQGGPEGSPPAQPPPARFIGPQLRIRRDPDPEREVQHRGQGEHRVQPATRRSASATGRS